VPRNPSFVVIDATPGHSNIEFANRVEEALLEHGVSVLSAPSLTQVETEQRRGLASTGERIEAGEHGTASIDDESVGAEASRRERYMAYADTRADYIVYLYDDPARIKITIRDTGEIIASFRWTGERPLADELSAVLNAAGVTSSSSATQPSSIVR
jgi:hypothetical protein